ncbi:DNA (cytosine-5)-methyltransferase 1 [Nonomuraea maritima]|uniref:DNA (cytosine-5-)-methyltransferase n=1 Tax=Nonomuraea maritima TaxID=683260 RepID=A0A1G9SI32_9ACTN|nr:DNA (cytosine-5-)-methyltransferase [Nonomuraea maritima]SDM35156.1 DNA (cytosine-5)-methyltransferase 1 [Nonomuraea maritima]
MALEVVEICAGAGGQALGLEKAGFEHALAVELDENASATLLRNRPNWDVRTGDVVDSSLWKPDQFEGVSLLAGGVPCPPFTIAGKQLGATDERDLFAWAVELVGSVKPQALMLENVRGLSMPRFAGYRQHVLDRLRELKYVAEWRLLQASHYGVPQLRPRFVLVALKEEFADYFHWPEKLGEPPTVGDTLFELMAADGWRGAETWREKANKIAPTIVGGSKKHGGADLGPTRAKRAWAEIGVDALGVADAPPTVNDDPDFMPKLTTEMVARIQGWDDKEFHWEFTGRKTSRYRQIGNAFPPPVAAAVGKAIAAALKKETNPHERSNNLKGDPIYRVLRESGDFMTAAQIARAIERKIEPSDATGLKLEPHELERRIALLGRDFQIEMKESTSATAYKLGEFRAFIGQDDHVRHEHFLKNRAKIS